MRALTFILLCLKIIVFTAIVLSVAWSATALYFLLLPYGTIASLAPWLFLASWPVIFLFYPKMLHVFAGCILSTCIIFVLWASIPPSHDREWRGEYARMPYAEYHDNMLKIHNIRDFEYHGSRDNFTPYYHTVVYNLNDLEGVDLVLSHWDDQVMIAHSMLVFRFQNAENLVVSVETRQEKDEPWDIPRGFFNQYELISILGTEKDLIGRRINISNQDVFLYPTTLNNQESREFLDNVIAGVNELYNEPQFYNTLSKNCTSSLFTVARRPDLFEWFNPELLLNGVSDRYAREIGLIEGKGSYWQFKYNHYISPKVKNMSPDEKFSEVIRVNQSL